MTGATPATEFVTDTVGLVLRLEKRKMGAGAKSVFDSAESGSAIIYVPSLVLAEMLYLSEKGRITATLRDAADYMSRHSHCKDYPLDLAVVQAAAQISDVRELHDRLIAGVARLLSLQLITNDLSIQASSFVRTLW